MPLGVGLVAGSKCSERPPSPHNPIASLSGGGLTGARQGRIGVVVGFGWAGPQLVAPTHQWLPCPTPFKDRCVPRGPSEDLVLRSQSAFSSVSSVADSCLVSWNFRPFEDEDNR